MKKDYYLILRLTPEATAEEIRSAYRRLAIELHPDLSGFGSDQFLELQEAYSVLSDPMRRAVYDRKAKEFPVRRADATWAGEDLIAAMHSAEPLTPAQPVSRLEEISLLRSFGFAGSGSIGPLPFDDFRFVDAVFERVIAASYLLVPELVFGV